MRLVFISDTHSLHDQLEVPDGDILLHSGDLTKRGGLEEIEEVNRWLGTLPHQHKVIIAGNHDFGFEKEPEAARALITNAIYLEDTSVTIEGLKIYGSPWQPWFFDWAFNVHRGFKLREIWEKIPADTDILLTHGPPGNILDKTTEDEPVGCMDLTSRLQELNLTVNAFGHIHEAYGQQDIDGTRYINASSVNRAYELVNAPVIMDI